MNMKPIALVIDDDNSYRMLLQFQLQSLGFSVVLATDGRTGLNLATLHFPTVIISDFTMPNMNGFEVWEAIQKDSRLRNMPFLILSAQVDSHWGKHEHASLHLLQAESLREGVALGLLAKGLPADALTVALRNLLGGSLPIDAALQNEAALGETMLVRA
jgi:CheY-like chemotaxis protein